MVDKLSEAKKHILKGSVEPSNSKVIKGYDFNKGVDYDAILDSFASTGFQASNFSDAVDVIKQMRKEKCTIYLGYTSNMTTSGLREVFRYLAEHKLVDVIVTTAGGVEEDFVKCLGSFLLGDFEAEGAKLRESGVNRTGNIFIPNKRYCDFEDWLTPILTKVADEQKGVPVSPSDIIARLGKDINNKESIYYWAAKNDIPVFCPAILDGSLGDMVYFFRFKRPDFKIEITEDQRKLNNITFDSKKTGVIILGAGVIKHAILNTNLLRNGCDYAVYINTAQEFDGSDSGARPDEAVSWGKILPKARSVKVYGDASILFPLIVARAFCK